ncbi:hypothetical protein L7F22_012340 [Adiantum nelumboides]|nr:hypothetical protein [Adiantum nelumboides]
MRLEDTDRDLCSSLNLHQICCSGGDLKTQKETFKPQNILLDENFCPKIADFGVAKLLAQDESAIATIARGTPGYIAPEFWMGGEGQISTKFDVYSALPLCTLL